MKKAIIVLLWLVGVSITMSAAKQPKCIWIAGETREWAEALAGSMEGTEIMNLAQAQVTIKSFESEGYWQQIMDQAKRGDAVWMQFGLKDLYNPESPDYSNIEDLEHHLLGLVTEAQKKGLKVVLLTPISRIRYNIHDEGQFYRSFGLYAEATRRVAERMQCELIDLEAKTAEQLKTLSEEEISALYEDEEILTPAGAEWVYQGYQGGLHPRTQLPLREEHAGGD